MWPGIFWPMIGFCKHGSKHSGFIKQFCTYPATFAVVYMNTVSPLSSSKCLSVETYARFLNTQLVHMLRIATDIRCPLRGLKSVSFDACIRKVYDSVVGQVTGYTQ